MKTLKLLIIEDNDEHAQIVVRYLSRSEGFNIQFHREVLLNAGLLEMQKNNYDAVLLDLRLPDSDLNETLPKAVAASVLVPIIVMSSIEDRDSAIKAVQDGASDYLCKSRLSSELLIRTVLHSMQRKETEALLRKQSNFNHILYELSQFALGGSTLDELRMQIRDSLKKSLDLDYVEFIQNIKVDASLISHLDRSIDDRQPSFFVDLNQLGLKETQDRIVSLGFLSGLNLLVKEQDNNKGYLLVLAYSLDQRDFNFDEKVFFRAVANIYSAALERKALQDQLQGKIKALNDANQKKDDFLATLSHELRTPLNIISGYLEVMRELTPGSEEYHRSLDKVDENVKAETKLISDILDLSRIITGKMTFYPEKFDLGKLARSTVEAVGFASSAKKIDVKFYMDPQVGPFIGDSNRIRQAMWNLLSNAVKFTPSHGEISVRAEIVNSSFVFTVQDTGRGISKENLSHVFDRFWQEDTSMSRTYMGLGLGLGIVRHIVELHGGEVQVSSAGRDLGSTFQFSIPMQNSVLIKDREDVEVVTHKKEASFYSLKDMRILMIDDSEDTLTLMKLLLVKEGAHVVCANSPQEGFLALKDERFDVVLSDIGMPEMNGYELIQHIRNWEFEQGKRKTPAIAFTAYVAVEDIARAIDAGFQAHVPKPTNIKELKEKIRFAIESLSQSSKIAG